MPVNALAECLFRRARQHAACSVNSPSIDEVEGRGGPVAEARWKETRF
jgi:hypothetical protein